MNSTGEVRLRPAGSGRQAGARNRIPRAVKEGLLLAAEHVGRRNHPERPFDGLVAFLEDIALQRPAVFVSLLARVLPLEANGERPAKVQMNLQIGR